MQRDYTTEEIQGEVLDFHKEDRMMGKCHSVVVGHQQNGNIATLNIWGINCKCDVWIFLYILLLGLGLVKFGEFWLF